MDVIIMVQFDGEDLMKAFHYSTKLPISILGNGKIEQSLPENLKTAAALAADKSILNLQYGPQEYNTVQYISTEYKELFIVYVIDDSYVVAVGPLLIEPMHSGEIVNIIQRQKVPIRLKSRLEVYYRDVTQVSTQTYYYCGRLLSAIFGAKNTGVPKNPHPIGSEVSSIKEYFQNTYKNREKLFTHPPFFLEKKIVNQIKIGNLDGALSTLDEINLLSRATLAKDPLRSMKDSIICSCAFFTRAVIEAGVFPDIAFTYSDTFIQQIEKMDSLAEVSRYERNILAEFIKLTKENASAKYSRVILSAMQYINDNLTLKLSLSDIAKHAYVHPNYLSSIFKKEVGCSLTDYIARRRIEESTYFVAYTDFEIADIANFYHFCNQSYYITTFKRFLSVSPNEYRNSDRPSL